MFEGLNSLWRKKKKWISCGTYEMNMDISSIFLRLTLGVSQSQVWLVLLSLQFKLPGVDLVAHIRKNVSIYEDKHALAHAFKMSALCRWC